MNKKNKCILSIICISVVLVVAVGIVLLLLLRGGKENYDLMKIDLQSVNSLAIGNNTVQSSKSINSATGANIFVKSEMLSTSLNETARSNNSMCLLSVDENGNVQKTKFKSGNNEIEPKMNLCAFNQVENYIILSYTTEKCPTFTENDFDCNEQTDTYVIDKRTGKIFKIDMFDSFSITLSAYGAVANDCGDFFVISHLPKYYKVYVENDILRIEEFFNNSVLPGDIDIDLMDKYGNAIVYRNDNNAIIYYVLNRQGKLNEIDFDADVGHGWEGRQELIRAYNGVIYTKEGKQLTQDGVFINVSNVPSLEKIPSETLIYSTNNEKYYYTTKTYGAVSYKWDFGKNVVLKVTEGDNGEYSVEKITLNFPNDMDSSKIVVAGQNIYTFTDNSISKFYVPNGSCETININGNIILKSIELFELDKIHFTGTNLSMQEVDGVIDSDKTVSYTYTEPRFDVYYVFPLN